MNWRLRGRQVLGAAVVAGWERIMSNHSVVSPRLACKSLIYELAEGILVVYSAHARAFAECIMVLAVDTQFLRSITDERIHELSFILTCAEKTSIPAYSFPVMTALKRRDAQQRWHFPWRILSQSCPKRSVGVCGFFLIYTPSPFSLPLFPLISTAYVLHKNLRCAQSSTLSPFLILDSHKSSP